MGIGEGSFTRTLSLSELAPRSFKFRKVVARFGLGVRKEGKDVRSFGGSVRCSASTSEKQGTLSCMTQENNWIKSTLSYRQCKVFISRLPEKENKTIP